LLYNPTAGDLIKGTGEIRKVWKTREDGVKATDTGGKIFFYSDDIP
jgi:hypothetical protein